MLFRSLAASVGLVAPAYAGLAAYYTAPWPGAQVIYQNKTTGDINYATCNSYGTPIMPRDPPNTFVLPYTAKKNSALTATGWFGQGTTWAVVIYQSLNNDIVQATYQCDMTKGSYNLVSNLIINGVKNSPNVNVDTGLSMNLLGATAGEHLYFHDDKGAVHWFAFTQDTSWTYGGRVSADQNLGSKVISSCFYSASNETIYYPKDAKNVEMAVPNTDHSVHISTFPTPLEDSNFNNNKNDTDPDLDTTVKVGFTLPAWDGNTKGIGSAIDKDTTKYFFYMGTDKKMHLATSSLKDGSNLAYVMQGDVSADLWPVADDANSELAIAFNPASYDVTLFYWSKGEIVVANQTGKLGNWLQSYTLPQTNTTASDSGGSSGLSSGAKAGLGVGVTILALLIIAAVVLFLLRRRRQQRARNEAAHGADMAMNPNAGGEHPQMTGQAPYDYNQVQQQQQYDYQQQQQYDYNNQYNNNNNQWGADQKKAFGPGAVTNYNQQHQPVGVEMPDSSPANHRLSELPSSYVMSHELPGAEVDRIQAASPDPHNAYTAPVSEHNNYATAGTDLTPGSPEQRPGSTVSWTGAHSPPPTYVSQSASPAPSNAYNQAYYPQQSVSPQVTGEYQAYSPDVSHSQPQQNLAVGHEQQQPQQHHDNLGAITEQHEAQPQSQTQTRGQFHEHLQGDEQQQQQQQQQPHHP